MEAFLLDSLPAVLAIFLGIVLGFWACVMMLRKGDSGSISDTPLIDLEERINQLVSQLRDLENYRARMQPDAYAEEKDRLEKEAAQTLKQRDEIMQQMQSSSSSMDSSPEGATAVVGFLARRPQLQGFLWGILVVGIGVALYTSLMDNHTVRPAQPGSMVGAGPMAGAGQGAGPQHNAELSALLAKLQADPNHIPSMNRVTRILLRQQMFNEADTLTRRVLELKPADRGALVHAAVLKSAGGDVSGAFTALDLVIDTHPKYADAWFFRGMLGMQSSKSDVMRESFEKYVEYAPDGPKKERIRGMLRGEGIKMPNQ